MVIMVCVLYTNTPTCQMKSTKAFVHLGVWRNVQKLACTLHQLGCLLIHVNDEYRGSRLGGGLGQKCMKIVTLICCICVHSACCNQNFFLRKYHKSLGKLFKPTLQYVNVPQLHRILTDCLESSMHSIQCECCSLKPLQLLFEWVLRRKKRPCAWPWCSMWWIYTHFHVDPEGAVCHGLQKWLFSVTLKHLCHTCLHLSKLNVKEVRRICESYTKTIG